LIRKSPNHPPAPAGVRLRELGRRGLLAAALLIVLGSCETRREPPAAAAAPAAAATTAAGARREIDRPLLPGAAVARPLAAGETLVFPVAAGAGRYLELAVDTSAVDAELTLVGPGGTALARAESRAGRWGTETVAAITEVEGEHRLEARGLPGATEAGELRVALVRSRPAAPDDRARVEEEGRFSRALALYEDERREAKEEALTSFRAAAASARAEADPAWRARALFFAGVTANDLGRLEVALPALEAALAGWERLGEKGWQAETHYRIGNCHALAGRYPQALTAFAAANRLWEGPDADRRRASTLNNQGFVHERLADYQQALDRYAAARELFAKLGLDEQAAQALVNVGAAYRKLGLPERALPRYERALAIWRTLGKRQLEALTLNNMGTCHEDLGRPRQALALYRQALAIAEEIGDLRLQGELTGNAGMVHLGLGEVEPALAACERADELARKAGDERQRCRSLLCRGLAQLAAARSRPERLERAPEPLRRAAELARTLGDRENLARAATGLARVRRGRGDLQGALHQLATALAVVEAVRSGVELESMRSSYFSAQRDVYELEIDLLADLARREPRQGWEEAALEASERARARGLLELLGETAAGLRAEVDPGLLESESELRARINALALAAGDGSPDRDRQIEPLVEQTEKVERRIRASHPGYAELAYPHPLTVAEMREQVLDPGTVLLQYSLGSERSLLWVLTPDSLELHELPGREVIDEAARELYALLSDAGGWRGPDWREHRRRYEESARRLSALVLGPVAESLRGERTAEVVLVAAEGALSYVPFAALVPPGGNEPLVARHRVVDLPSASVLAAVRRAAAGRARPAGELLVFADPVFSREDSRLSGAAGGTVTAAAAEDGEPALASDAATAVPSALRSAGWEGFERLRHSRDEALAIAALVPAGQRRLRIGFDATREAVLDGSASGYRLLHFATHGILDARRPRLSGLVLSLVDEAGRPRDGVLRLHDVYALDLAADLVVLSACETGLGREVRSEGLVGLTRGFLHAGARSVIASLWRVDDRATADLMRRLYRGILVDGLAPAAALSRAQRELLAGAGEPEWRAPYYWAPFVLHGEWRGVDPTSSTSSATKRR
jgi:CHAT domain-containing protein/tetratricopeptide (TPR) repeat protein